MMPADAGRRTLGPYRALAHHFTVSTPSGPLADEVARVLAGLSDPDAPRLANEPAHADLPPSTCRYGIEALGADLALDADGDPIDAGPTPAHVLAMLLWDVNRRAVAATAPDHVVMHAGAVVVDGRAVVLPAPMEAGKTTLVTALVRAGCGYLSDELATLPDPGSHVLAYPKALSVDPGSWPLFPDLEPDAASLAASPNQWLITPDTIRPGAAHRTSAPLGMIVLPRHRSGQATTLTRLPPVDALRALAECTFQFHEDPARLLPRLARIAESVPVHRLVVGDGVDEAVRAVAGAI